MSCKELEVDMLIEALHENYGIISSTIEYIKEKYKVKISRDAVYSRIKLWGMQDYVTECRIRGVEKAYRKRFSTAIDNGVELALGWIIATYGHHADFLEPKEDNGLERNKGDIINYLDSLKKSKNQDNQ